SLPSIEGAVSIWRSVLEGAQPFHAWPEGINERIQRFGKKCFYARVRYRRPIPLNSSMGDDAAVFVIPLNRQRQFAINSFCILFQFLIQRQALFRAGQTQETADFRLGLIKIERYPGCR